jgi:hypothetical protein
MVLVRLGVAALAAGAMSFAPAASADTTCQAVDETTSVCVTTGDPTAGGGAGVSAGPLCVVVLAACP